MKLSVFQRMVLLMTILFSISLFAQIREVRVEVPGMY